VSERNTASEPFGRREKLAMKCAKWLQTDSSTTKLTQPTCSFRSSFIKNAPRFALRSTSVKEARRSAKSSGGGGRSRIYKNSEIQQEQEEDEGEEKTSKMLFGGDDDNVDDRRSPPQSKPQPQSQSQSQSKSKSKSTTKPPPQSSPPQHNTSQSDDGPKSIITNRMESLFDQLTILKYPEKLASSGRPNLTRTHFSLENGGGAGKLNRHGQFIDFLLLCEFLLSQLNYSNLLDVSEAKTKVRGEKRSDGKYATQPRASFATTAGRSCVHQAERSGRCRGGGVSPPPQPK